MKTTSRRRTKRPNLTNLMPVISSCSMSYASMSVTATTNFNSPEEPGRTLTAADFTQKAIMPKVLNDCMFQEKKRSPGTTIIPEKLYLTSVIEAENLNFLKNNKITAILTINTEPVKLPFLLEKNSIKTKFVNLGDNCTSHIKSYFDEMNDFIDSNERVVVHCHAGISRSGTAVIAYVMKTLKLNMEQAFKFVQSKRHVVCPNFSFMGQLRSYQNDLQMQYLEENFLTIKTTPEKQRQALVTDDLKAETKTRKQVIPPLGVFSKLELNGEYHDSGVDTSESSPNESPLGSPKNKIQRIEFQNVNIEKTLPMQI